MWFVGLNTNLKLPSFFLLWSAHATRYLHICAWWKLEEGTGVARFIRCRSCTDGTLAYDFLTAICDEWLAHDASATSYCCSIRRNRIQQELSFKLTKLEQTFKWNKAFGVTWFWIQLPLNICTRNSIVTCIQTLRLQSQQPMSWNRVEKQLWKETV